MTNASDTPTSNPPAAAANGPPHGRWKKRAFKVLAALVVLFLLAPLALALPPVRTKIADTLGAKLGRRVEIGGMSGYWFKGIDIDDIVVHSPAGFDGPLATVRSVHADVDVWGALFGSITAKVRVMAPHITLRRAADGRSNADGVMETLQAEDEDASQSSGSDSDLEVIVIGGKVESLAGTEIIEGALHEIDLGMTLRPGGRMRLEFQGVAAGAATGGGNARLRATADLDKEGSGPFEVDVPSLDLGRLARLVEDAANVRDLAGTIEVKGKGSLRGDGTVDGTFSALGSGLSARTADGARVSVDRLVSGAVLGSARGTTSIDASASLNNLRIVEAAIPGRSPGEYREPSLVFTAKATYHPEGWLHVSEGGLNAGTTARITMPKPFKLQTKPDLRFQGELSVRADLARVGALRALIPALEPLGGGSLTMAVTGTGDRGLEVDAQVQIDQLSLRPSELFPQGYVEPSVLIALRASQSAKDGTTLRLKRVDSRLVRATMRDPVKGLALGIDAEDRAWVDGGFDLSVDLPSLSRLLASKLTLEPGERIGGTLTIGGTGTGEAEAMRLDTQVRLRSVLFPASWGGTQTPAELRVRLQARNERGATHLSLTDLAGMGLSGTAEGRLRRDGGESQLASAEAQVGLDLAQGTPWLVGLARLGPGTRFAGALNAAIRVGAEGKGQRLDANVQIDQFRYQGEPGGGVWRDERVVLRANALLAEEGGTHRANELKLTTDGMALEAAGATYRGGDIPQLEALLKFSGNATTLAPNLAALMGEGYRDLRGQGPINGRVTLRGSTAEHMRTLLVDGNVMLGAWTSSGLQVSDLKVSATRSESRSPLSLGLVCALNRGRAFSQGTLRLGTPEMAWTCTTDLTNVDTSGVVTSGGLGRIMAFALPALLPATSATPVLSGLLTAHGEFAAPSIDDPALMDGLKGTARLTMTQGEIRNSTLFGGSGGSNSAVARVITGLKVAVPEAGRILEGATKALTFSDLASDVRVADRVVHVERTKLTGQSLVITMRGTVHFDKRVALQSDAAIQGSAGQKLARYLPGGAIPLQIGGTLGAPQVRPNVDMSKLLAGAVGNPKDLLEQVKDPKELIDRVKKDLPKLPKIPNPFK